jgi:hypothetical protein
MGYKSTMRKIRSDLTGTVICGLRLHNPTTVAQLTSYAACHDAARVRNALHILMREGTVRRNNARQYELVV